MPRLLIISTTYFPDPNVAAIRMTQLCRHLPQHGWKPHVLCRYYGFESSAKELAAKVHPDVTLEYLNWTEPQTTVGSKRGTGLHLTRLARSMRSHRLVASLVVPDLSIRFWRSSRQQILRRVLQIRPNVIITTSPPHSNHDIGLWLAGRTGIPWIADFRDPYLIDNRFRPTGLGCLRLRAHRRFEQVIYDRAALTVHAIPIQARWACKMYPSARARIRILTNGIPPELVDGTAGVDITPGNRASIRVIGTIPEPEEMRLAQAIATLVDEGMDLELRVIGKYHDNLRAIQSLLGERMVALGQIAHEKALRQMAGADLLVNYLDQARSETLLLSTKMLEYWGTGKPIIAINPSRSDRLFFRKLSGIYTLTRPSHDELVDTLRIALQRGQNGSSPESLSRRTALSWPRQAAQLAEWLNELSRTSPRRSIKEIC